MSYNEVRDLVDQRAFDRLERYVSLLDKWRKVTNLISDTSFKDVWLRHILDGIFLQRQRPKAKSWIDFGSGAGFPSVVIANLIVNDPGAQVHCVEIDRRKCSFLREVAESLKVPMKIHNTLAENLDPLKLSGIEVVTARAFSSIEKILAVANPFLITGAVAILPRGRHGSEEVAQIVPGGYTVKVSANPSPGDGVFVEIKLRA